MNVAIDRIFQLIFYSLSLYVLTNCEDAVKTNCIFGSRSPKDLTRLQNLENKRYDCTYKDDKDDYVYNIGICTNADQNAENEGTVHAGAVQRKPDGTETKRLGNYTIADFREGDDWLILEYYGGDNYHSHCNGNPRSTMIMLMCAPGVKGDLKMLEESSDSTNNCFYLFELKTKYACSSSKSKLSVGSIIVIVFLSLVAVYLLFGFLVQRFVKGAKGLEQIPNYSFWRDAGNMAADGCDLVFRSHSSADSREYRGVSGDDTQEITRDSNTPDDHLLSM